MNVTDRLPAELEICVRMRDGQPCLGVIYRPWPTLAYCPKCGSKDAGVVYVRTAAAGDPPGLSAGS